MIKGLALFGTALVSLGGSVAVQAGDIDLVETQTLTLPNDGLELLDIDASAGFLVVEGSDSNEIEVTAELSVVDGEYELKLDRSGDRAMLVADANTSRSSSWFNDSPRIDLTVKMPKALALKIKDGSGYIDIKNIGGSVQIKDGSGEITAENLGADLKINDGSGGMTLSKIGGEVVIDDGSGSIELTQVTGGVELEDGSGSVVISDVGGTVDVDDGSGNLTIDKVQGHVTIDDGSGGIDVDTLMDGLTVINSGSGRLAMKNVKGNIVTD